MAVVFLEGFDKYGGANSNNTSVAALLTAGEWNSAGAALNIVAPLSATGNALSFVSQNNALSKTLAASYGRLIGGFRFSSNLGGFAGIQFNDAGTAQASIAVTSSGVFIVRNGAISSGTILGTSTVSVSANSTHYLEFDITFGNAAAYQVWLDGVSILGPASGDTTTTANNTANGISLSVGTGAVWAVTVDDFYLFDATGTTNNAALLTSPRIETTFPASDSAVQFAFGAGILGSSVPVVTSTSGGTANFLTLRRFIPSVACTLNSISTVVSGASVTANFRGVVYADSAGVAGALLSSGTTVTGNAANVPVILPLITPQNLVAGTAYWLGWMTDTNGSTVVSDGLSQVYRVAATFSSGAPATAGVMTVSTSYMIWGNLTGISVNSYEVSQRPPVGQYSYVYDSTVAHEDLYTFAPLTTSPNVIHSVAVKAYTQKSDSGTRTVSMRTKSGATDSGGSLTGQVQGTTFGWLGSYFPVDPNTSAAWIPANLDAATSGFRIDS